MIIYIMFLVVLSVFGWAVVWWWRGGLLEVVFCFFLPWDIFQRERGRLGAAMFCTSGKGMGVVRLLLVRVANSGDG